MPKSPYGGCQCEGGSEDIRRNRGKIAENSSGLMVDFLRLIDVNAGGLQLKKGQGILHLRKGAGAVRIPTRKVGKLQRIGR